MNATKPKVAKVILVGEDGAGKTSFLHRFIYNTFPQPNNATIGGNFRATIKVKETEITFDFWDTAGQERYGLMVPMYYRGSRGAFLCFDLTNRESFIKTKIWLKQIADNAPSYNRTVLVGTKADLSDRREVSNEEATELAQQAGFPYIEISSRLGINIKEAMTLLAEQIEDTGFPEEIRSVPATTSASRSWCNIL